MNACNHNAKQIYSPRIYITCMEFYHWAEQSVTDKKAVALETFSLYKFRLTKAPSSLQLLMLAPNDKLLLN